MGYDLEMRQRPASLPAGFTPPDPARPGYYRFSVVGMEMMRKIMGRAGLLDESVKMDWPAWPPEEWDEQRAWDLVGALDEEPGGDTRRVELATLTPPVNLPERVTVLRYLSKRDAHRSIRSDDPARVPRIKFASNDYWTLAPDECRLIAAGLGHALVTDGAGLWEHQADLKEPEMTAWIQQWIRFNEIAAEHGGYRVF